jgi:crossover junction endodeoxyribonuclease RuvC
MAAETLRVLGVDTSLRSTGVGVVELRGGRMTAIEYGVVPFPAKLPHSACLSGLYAAIALLVQKTAPQCAAIEGVFFSRNLKTTLVLGEARGAVIAACAGAGLPVYEYAPRSVKQALVGFGGAEKEQVRRMLMAQLGLATEPQEDAGDALALAICHLQRGRGHESLAPEPI